MEPRDLSRGVAQHCWLLLTRAGFPYKNSWGHEMASGETCQTCSTGCWRVCSPLTWGTPHLQHLLMLRILSSYWSKFPLRSPCSQRLSYLGHLFPLGMPAGHSGADVAVGRWREHWVPNEVQSREARLESSGMPIPEVQTTASHRLCQLCSG